MRSTPRLHALRRPALLGTIGTGAVTAALLVLPAAPSQAIPPGGAVDRSNGASVKLHSSSVKRGGRIKVSGRNWKAKGNRTSGRAEVTVKIDDRHILAIFPLRNKKFSGYVRIPKQISKGRHTLRFLAAKPATSIKSKSFRVR